MGRSVPVIWYGSKYIAFVAVAVVTRSQASPGSCAAAAHRHVSAFERFKQQRLLPVKQLALLCQPRLQPLVLCR